MTVVNKVFTANSLGPRRSPASVRGHRCTIQHDFLAVIHPIHRLRYFGHDMQTIAYHHLRRLRLKCSSKVVPRQHSPNHRYLYRLKKLGMFLDNIHNICTISDLTIQQFLSIPVYTIFKNLTIIIIVSLQADLFIS